MIEHVASKYGFLTAKQGDYGGHRDDLLADMHDSKVSFGQSSHASDAANVSGFDILGANPAQDVDWQHRRISAGIDEGCETYFYAIFGRTTKTNLNYRR